MEQTLSAPQQDDVMEETASVIFDEIPESYLAESSNTVQIS